MVEFKSLPKLYKEITNKPATSQSAETVVTKYNLPAISGTSAEDFKEDIELVKDALVQHVLPLYDDDKPAVVTYNEDEANEALIASNLIDLAKKHSGYHHVNTVIDKMVDFDAYLAKLYKLGVLKMWRISGEEESEVIFYLVSGGLVTEEDEKLLSEWIRTTDDNPMGGEKLKNLQDPELVAKVHFDAAEYYNNKTQASLRTLLSTKYNKALVRSLERVDTILEADMLYQSFGITTQLFA